MTKYYRPVQAAPWEITKDLIVTLARPKVRFSGIYWQNGNGTYELYFFVRDTANNYLITPIHYQTPQGNGDNIFDITLPKDGGGNFTLNSHVIVGLQKAPWYGDYLFDIKTILCELVT